MGMNDRPGPGESVYRRGAADDTDVEGHGFKRSATGEEEDTEGNAYRRS